MSPPTRTLRRERMQAARLIRRSDLLARQRSLTRAIPGRAFDATTEADPGPPPEAVFDRVTGPFDRRRGAPSSSGEEP